MNYDYNQTFKNEQILALSNPWVVDMPLSNKLNQKLLLNSNKVCDL